MSQTNIAQGPQRRPRRPSGRAGRAGPSGPNPNAIILVLSVAGSYLAFDQFYIMTAGQPFNETATSVFWVYQNSFPFLKLGYGAAYLKDVQLLHAGGSYYAPESEAKHARARDALDLLRSGPPDAAVLESSERQLRSVGHDLVDANDAELEPFRHAGDGAPVRSRGTAAACRSRWPAG